MEAAYWWRALPTLTELSTLVHAAGAMIVKPLDRTALADLEQMMTLHVASPLRLTQVFWKQLQTAGSSAAVIFLTSLVAHQGGSNLGAYAASKAAEHALAMTLAKELAPVRVNCVAPGVVATDMMGHMAEELSGILNKPVAELLSSFTAKQLVKRVTTTGDVAKLVRMVIDNPALTGTTFHINGGSLVT